MDPSRGIFEVLHVNLNELVIGRSNEQPNGLRDARLCRSVRALKKRRTCLLNVARWILSPA
jgi:hypothetical protein